MQNKLDNALDELIEMAIDAIADVKKTGRFSKDFAEAVCIVLSMAYGRYTDDQ